MTTRHSLRTKTNTSDLIEQEETILEKKVDINILLNRVKIEKKDAIRKNFIITAGAITTLAITGLITVL
tara:strand:- start:275 stop:481 length:207 start_codon:yes stop_codon:yes gene_type:complete